MIEAIGPVALQLVGVVLIVVAIWGMGYHAGRNSRDYD
jgi:hypothetical protein